MFKEAILYINTIVELTQLELDIQVDKEINEKKDDLDVSLPIIDMTPLIITPQKENCPNAIRESTNKADEIFLVPILQSNDATVAQKNYQKRGRINQQGAILRTQRNKSVPVDADKFEESQSTHLKAQLGKRSKKNEKGETELHLAVMNVRIHLKSH